MSAPAAGRAAAGRRSEPRRGPTAWYTGTVTGFAFEPGGADLDARVSVLAERLTEGLRPLARVAYNYRWAWAEDGPEVFRDVNPHRWALSGQNPVRFLGDLWPATQEAVERDPALLERVRVLAERVDADLARPARPRAGLDGPVVFMCAEFGFHQSMPIYSGGLGVLAGDILKEASDQALPMIGIGLLYRRGYFKQRLDAAGRQQEYWLSVDPKSLPMARVGGPDGEPLQLSLQVFDRELAFQVWRVDVGRVPLLLLDAEVPQNDPVFRWTSARLYESNRAVRLAQYALLGIGGARVLQALGIEPGVIHLNEGHPALAPLELATQAAEEGERFESALAAIGARTVFTTHTPVPAGNETYEPGEFLAAYGDIPGRLGIDDDAFLGLFRVRPGDLEERPGLTPFALRVARRRNGVSALHGEVARHMWRPLFDGRDEIDVPVTHVTNGIHVPTFVAPPLAALFDTYLGDGWRHRTADPSAWEGVHSIPNEELWAARRAARLDLVEYVREKNQQDRLLRGEQIDYVRSVERLLDPDALTLGFARRLATYKRLHLLAQDPERARRIMSGPQPVQLLVAGKAHPADGPGKDTLQRLYNLKREENVFAERLIFVEDYDLSVAQQLVAGCDVWINLPRRPMEASGTSGMKAALNGGLQLSVLDGWWAEGYDGSNGWAIPGDEDPDQAAADWRDSARYYDLLEHEVIPLFYERDESGVPHGWCELIKRSLVTLAPRFSATRMLDDYVERIYPVD
jgi:starch phosphorylase